jgi:GT2 family glycosyltransferase
MSLTLSVIVPTWNNPELLRACLRAIRASTIAPCEIVVVDDCSEQPCDAICAEFDASLTRPSVRSGSAAARNLGARIARGDIVVFVDEDVCVSADTLEHMRADFAADDGLAAVFGSYEEMAGATNFVSRYKNFQHHYVHQHSRPDAWTFWTGCGAVRRQVFLAHGGFRVTYPRPDIEDIEFGMRLRRAGGRLRLNRSIRARHMKRYSVRSLIRSDAMGRAAPWTELLLSHRCLPDDLNLRWMQRLSVMLTVLFVLMVIVGCTMPLPRLWMSFALLAIGAAIVWMNRDFYAFLASRWGMANTLGAIAFHFIYYLSSAAGAAIGLARYVIASRHYDRPWSQPRRSVRPDAPS